MEKVRRKRIRLPETEYRFGWFFVTVCTYDRKEILAKIVPDFVGADDSVRPCGALPSPVILSAVGEVVKECLEQLIDEENGITVNKYVIMPNHVHAIVCIDATRGGQSRPPLQKMMQKFKSMSTRRVWNMGYTKLWQRSYFDHVIRNEADYFRIWQYIDDNPAHWAEDEYYIQLGENTT